MRGRNSKSEKSRRNSTSLGLLQGEMGLKSRDTQKARLGLLLNIHTKYQLPSSIWRGDGGGTIHF